MIVIGLVIFAIAVAAAIVAIVSNQSAMVQIHALGYTWNVHAYGVLIAGLVIAAVGLIGVAMMRSGAAHSARIRAQRRGLVRENARLNELAADRSTEPVAPTAQGVMPTAAADEPSNVPVTAGRTDAYSAPVTYQQAPAPRHRQLFHRARQV
jgi:hypothetical protein